MDRESPRFSRDKHEFFILVEGLFQQRCYSVVSTEFSHFVSTSLIQSCQDSLIQPCRRQLLRFCFNKLVTSLQTSCDKPVTTSDNNVCVDFWLASDSNKLVTSLQQNCYNWCVFGRVHDHTGYDSDSRKVVICPSSHQNVSRLDDDGSKT